MRENATPAEKWNVIARILYEILRTLQVSMETVTRAGIAISQMHRKSAARFSANRAVGLDRSEDLRPLCQQIPLLNFFEALGA